MTTRHDLRVGPQFVIRTPSRKTVQRKLKTAETMDGFVMKPGFLYTVVRAISARVNQNYDGWPSEELKKSAHTFVGKPVFVNHENYDPTKARGVVVAARYIENGNDKYIEVIQEIDAQRFPKLAHEIKTGGLDSVSMGAEAGFTICSYCGNKAYDVPDMCDHVLFHKGERLSKFNRKTGKREEVLVYESCHKLSFFELSYVFDPADETAVASKVVMASNHTAADCPPGKDCTHHAPDEKPMSGMAGFGNPKSTAESSGGGSSSGGGAGQTVGGGELGDPASSVTTGTPTPGSPQHGDAKVMPHTKPLYDDLTKSLPGTEIGTYRVDDYHEHDHGAMDVMTSDPAQAEMVRQKAFDSGAPYVLWQQQQWNADGTVSDMPDRGDPTQNHMDHVHIAPINASFERKVLRTAGFKVADKCHYCNGDAEEGFSSCSGHRKMEENKFTKKVLEAMGVRSFEADVISEFYGEPDPFAGMKTFGENPMYTGYFGPPPEEVEPQPEVGQRSIAARVLQAAGMGKPTWVPHTSPEGETMPPPDPSKPVYTHFFFPAYKKMMQTGEPQPNLWSVGQVIPHPETGKPVERVHGYTDQLHLNNAQFKVDKSGNAKSNETGTRNVHAKVWGMLPSEGHHAAQPEQPLEYSGINYNHTGNPWFFHRDVADESDRIDDAEHVHFTPDGKTLAARSDNFGKGSLNVVHPVHPSVNAANPHTVMQHTSSFTARVLQAWGEIEAPAAVDTLREEGSAPEDDNNDFYHYVEPPKELQTPDLSVNVQIDREQDQSGQANMDGVPGEFSPEMGDPAAMGNPAGMGDPTGMGGGAPQQQYMELKIPIPPQGQAGAGSNVIPMQPYQAQPPAAPPAPPQQIAASTLNYFSRYFGREMNLQTLENGHAGFTKSRNPMKGTANMASSTLASRGKAVTAGRRQHFAEGPLVDTGDQSRNDQGEQEEIFLSQTPPAEGVVTPKDGEEISNTENNLVAKVRRGRDQLLRDAQALAAYRTRKTAGDHDEAGGPVATEVNPTVPAEGSEELTGDHFESADPNAGVVETQPKDASLHAFKQFDRWLAKKTGRPSRQHTSATIRRAADDYSRAAGVSVQALFPALSIVLREARKNENVNTKGANMRKRADEKLEVAAPDDRIDVEAPTEGTTDAEAQASQYDLHDFGNNAGDNLADPDLSTDQNWAPGEAKKSSKVKVAGGILAFRCAEAMIAAGLEPNTVERKYQLAGQYENANRALVQNQIALCERFAKILADTRRKAASGSTRGAALQPPIPAGLTQGRRTASTQRVATNDPRNDSTLFV